MLLALDIGNTNIKVGLFDGLLLKYSWRLAVDRNGTADEYGVKMESFFLHLGVPTSIISDVMFSSVIPSMNYTIEHMSNIYFPRAELMQVTAGLKTGLKIEYDYPQRLGPDRICNAVAARKLYDDRCLITVDFGTATTFNVVLDDSFLGGLICPGFKVSTNALIDSAAMLPRVEYIKPESIIGKNTEHCMQSGIYFGYVGQLEYLVRKIKAELNTPALVIATGGMGNLFAHEANCVDEFNPTLTLEGLAFLHELNK